MRWFRRFERTDWMRAPVCQSMHLRPAGKSLDVRLREYAHDRVVRWRLKSFRPNSVEPGGVGFPYRFVDLIPETVEQLGRTIPGPYFRLQTDQECVDQGP